MKSTRWLPVVLLLAAAGPCLWGCTPPRGAFHALKSSTAMGGPRSSWSANLAKNLGIPAGQSPSSGQAETAAPSGAAAVPDLEKEKQGQLAMARLYERRGELKYAKAIYEGTIKRRPGDPLPHHRLAVIAVREGRFADAESHFRTAAELTPPSADLLSDMGYSYYLQHRLPEAENVLRSVLAQTPDHPAATNNLALVCGAEGQFDESLALFKRVNNEAESYANLGYVLSQYGDYDRAEDAYRYALTLDNKLKVAAKAMVQIHERRQVQKRLATARASRPAPERETTIAATQLVAEPACYLPSQPNASSARQAIEITPIDVANATPQTNAAPAPSSPDATPSDEMIAAGLREIWQSSASKSRNPADE